MKKNTVQSNHLRAGIESCRLTLRTTTMKMNLLAAGLTTLLLAASPAFAGSNWDGEGTDDYWSNTNNWDGDTLPLFPDDVASFGTTNTTRLTPTNDLTGVVLKALNFAAGAQPFTLYGNAVTITNPFAVIQYWGNPPTLITQTVNMPVDLSISPVNVQTFPNGDLIFGGPILGTKDLYKNNGGNLTLSGDNSAWTGQVQVRNGTLKLGGNSALTSKNVLILNPNFGNTATVDLLGNAVTVSWMAMAGGGGTEVITDSVGGGALKMGGTYMSLNGGAGPATWSCAVDLIGGYREFFIHDPFSMLTISGPVINSSATPASFVKMGVGTLILSGTNTYNGNTIVNNGTLQLDFPGLPASTALIITNTAALNLNFFGTNVVSEFRIDGVSQAPGVYDATSNPGLITGTGALLVPEAKLPGNPINVAVSAGDLTFSVTNSSGSYVVQASTNLADPGGWVGIVTNAAPFNFTDTNAVNLYPLRFYRTVAP